MSVVTVEGNTGSMIESQIEASFETEAIENQLELEDESLLVGVEFDEAESEESSIRSQGPAKKLEKKRPTELFKWIIRIPYIDEISLTESESLPDAYDEAEEVANEYEVTATVEEKLLDFPELDFDFIASEEDEEDKVLVEEKPDTPALNMFEAMARRQAAKRALEFREPSTETMVNERALLEANINDFLTEMFDTVANFAESEMIRAREAGLIDKMKLFKEFVVAVEELSIERKVNKFANRKVVHYYRRHKTYRPLLPEENETIFLADSAKYEKALSELDCVLGREVAIKEAIAKKFDSDKELLASLEEKEKNQIAELEDLIKTTFKRRRSPTLDLFVTHRIREMSNLRMEISMMREKYIKEQHNFSVALKKRAEFEYITEELHVDDYEKMLDEKNFLLKKLEEKSIQLVKARGRFVTKIHAIAHVRETQSMIACNVKTQLNKLAEAQRKQQELRNHLFNLKSHRIQIKKQLYEEIANSGLISRPALLHDFDRADDRVQILKAKVDALKTEKARLEKKLSFLERSLTRK